MIEQKDQRLEPEDANLVRISSTRFRFAPRSECPAREAERTWITDSSADRRNSTSSTNLKMEDLKLAARYLSDSVVTVPPAEMTAALIFAIA